MEKKYIIDENPMCVLSESDIQYRNQKDSDEDYTIFSSFHKAKDCLIYALKEQSKQLCLDDADEKEQYKILINSCEKLRGMSEQQYKETYPENFE